METLNGAMNVAPAWKLNRESYYKPLAGTVTVDTVIVGGGVAGLATAFELSQRGIKVALLEAGKLSEGSTGWCAGILSSATTLDLQLVEKAFGEEMARRIASEVISALERYQSRFPEGQWQSGSTLYFAAKRGHIKSLSSEAKVRAAYHMAVKQLSKRVIPAAWQGFHGALRAEQEYAANPTRLMMALANAIVSAGGHIFEGSAMTRWTANKGVVSVCTIGGVVKARNLVLAVGLKGMSQPERKRLNHLIVPVTGHIMVTKPSKAVSDLVRDGGVIAAWDSLQLYHYVRYLADGRLLVGGGEQAGASASKVLTARSPYIKELHRWAQEHHTFEVPEVECAWRAGLIFPGDGLPFVQNRESHGCRIVTVVTDGLPFGFALGGAVTRLLIGGEDWLCSTLSEQRPVPLMVRMLQLLPASGLVRSLAERAALQVLHVADQVM